MKAKPIVPRELATRDVDEAIEHYLNEGAEEAAFGFIDALSRPMPTSVAILQPARHAMPMS